MSCGYVACFAQTRVLCPPAQASSNNANQQEFEFDAWPSEAAKAKIDHAKPLGAKYIAICEQERELSEKFWEYDSDASSELSPMEEDVSDQVIQEGVLKESEK